MKLNLGPNSNQSPEKGSILISEPFLEDPFFKRTVILLCDHNSEGSFGFVLNNYIDMNIEEIIDGIDSINSKISIGGPVKNSNLYYIHTLGEEIEGSVHIFDNVYMGGDYEQLKELIKTDQILPDQVRFFVGYSGWSANQLETELEQKSWFVTELGGQFIMNTNEGNLWKKSLEKFGVKGKVVSNIPLDPSQN